MRFTALIFAGAFAVANAQTSMSPASSSSDVSTPAPAAPTVKSPLQKCLDACPAADVNCKANCNNVPSPDASQVNATTSCVAACPQGDGSKAETERYAACQNDCISKHYFASSGGTPKATGAPADGNAGGNVSSGTNGASSSSGAAAASPTGSSPSPSNSSEPSGTDSSDSSVANTGASSATSTSGSRSSSVSRSGASSSSSSGLAPAATAAPAAVLGLALAILAL